MKKLSLNQVAGEFEIIDDQTHMFYNTETGEFDFYSDFSDFGDEENERFEEDCWIPCPRQSEIGEYDMMADFAKTVTDPHKNELLCVALEGKGAFRRFKDTLYRVGLVDEWYSFKHDAYVDLAREWCEDNELEYIDDSRKARSIARKEGEIVMPLDTLTAIHTRYSCRAFSNKMPSDDHLQMIAEAAVAAPSAMNRQPWRIIVVKNKRLLDELETEGIKNLAALPDKSIYERIMSRGGKLYYNTPCQIIVPIAEGGQPDCGIVAENIALAAASLGIDSLICGLASFSFSGEKGAEFKHRLDFPEGYEIGISVLLGYAEKPGGKPHEPDLGKITVIK